MLDLTLLLLKPEGCVPELGLRLERELELEGLVEEERDENRLVEVPAELWKDNVVRDELDLEDEKLELDGLVEVNE